MLSESLYFLQLRLFWGAQLRFLIFNFLPLYQFAISSFPSLELAPFFFNSMKSIGSSLISLRRPRAKLLREVLLLVSQLWNMITSHVEVIAQLPFLDERKVR